MKTVKRYKYLRLTGKKIKSDSGEMTWKVGEWYKTEGELDICYRGFHCSKEIDEAFSYVQGEVVAVVECRGKSIVEDNKECWEEMRIVEAKKWDKKASVALSIYVAELVLKNYEKEHPENMRPREAIEAAKKVLKSDTAKNRAAARSAVESARSAAWSAAWSAASSAAWSARSAVESARSAAWSARSAAWSAASSAVESAASSAVESAASSAVESARSAAESAAREEALKKIRTFMEEQYENLEEVK